MNAAVRALEIANADFDAGMTFGLSRADALPILLRAATPQAEREAERAGLPSTLADELAGADAAAQFAHGAEFYAYGPRTRAAEGRLAVVRKAASDWRATQSLEAAE